MLRKMMVSLIPHHSKQGPKVRRRLRPELKVMHVKGRTFTMIHWTIIGPRKRRLKS
uniref:Uncharacterized protein n=1 Tax=Arundo donax TaxID=35708 RepID=A0A0A9B5W0_ARUDO